MKIGVLILAAGYSKRMGENKALLRFNDDYTFLDQLISQYHLAGINHIHIVSQENKLPLNKNLIRNRKMQIQFLKNENPQLGRSYSIYFGLQEFKSFDKVFIQNIDNPFTNKDLIKTMVSKNQSNKVIVPQVEKKNSHPILLPHKLFSQIFNKPIDTFDFRDFFSDLPKQFVEWDMKNIRANINTQDDYNRWIK